MRVQSWLPANSVGIDHELIRRKFAKRHTSEAARYIRKVRFHFRRVATLQQVVSNSDKKEDIILFGKQITITNNLIS